MAWKTCGQSFEVIERIIYMKVKYCILLTCLFTSCALTTDNVKENISYIQDPNTDISFAKGTLLVDLDIKQVFTSVFCTEK